jgi:hypothetical protein
MLEQRRRDLLLTRHSYPPELCEAIRIYELELMLCDADRNPIASIRLADEEYGVDQRQITLGVYREFVGEDDGLSFERGKEFLDANPFVRKRLEDAVRSYVLTGQEERGARVLGALKELLGAIAYWKRLEGISRELVDEPKYPSLEDTDLRAREVADAYRLCRAKAAHNQMRAHLRRFERSIGRDPSMIQEVIGLAREMIPDQRAIEEPLGFMDIVEG